MITRIRIRGFKSFDDVEIRLGNLVVLFGPNGSGKSNLLDALQLLARLVSTPSLGDAFQPPYRGTPLESFMFDPGGVKSLLEKDSLSFSLEVDLRLSQQGVKVRQRQKTETGLPPGLGRIKRRLVEPLRFQDVRYRVELTFEPKRNRLLVTDELFTALTKAGNPTIIPGPFIGTAPSIFFAKQEHGGIFRWRRPSDSLSMTRPFVSLAHPYTRALDRELSNWRFYYLEPRERMRRPSPLREESDIGSMGEKLAGYLYSLKLDDPRQFDVIERALQAVIPAITKIDVSPNDDGEIELKLYEGNVPMPARVVSEGTLRVLGLLTLLGSKHRPRVIGFEEPENGMHPRRVGLAAQLIQNAANRGDSQIILTTHSPLLPDLLPEDSLYVCSKIDRYTRIQPYTELARPGDRSRIPSYLNGVESDLEDGEDIAPPRVSERIVRGEFDG